jgi:signal transduction histidine kinase
MSFNKNQFVFSLLFIPALFDYLLALLVILKNINREKFIFSLYCMFVGTWTLSIAFFGIVSLDKAFFWNKLFILSAGFLPATLLHFTYLFIKEKLTITKYIVIYLPILLITFQVIYSPTFYIENIVLREWGKESILGVFYFPYGIYFVSYAAFSFLKIILRSFKVQGIEKQRCIYLLFAMVPTALVGAYFNLFLILIGNYRYIWVGPYCSFIMVFTTAYAIVRYRLMDIRLAATNISIFITIYLLVLGIPFGVGFYLLGSGEWLLPMTLMAILATSGPFLFLYFQRRAEAKILLDQRHYQSTLRKASLGMGRIKDLKRLLGLIVHIVTKTVRIEHCSIYLFHETSKQYVLKSSKGVTSKPLQSVLQEDSDLLRYLNKIKEPIVCEEIYQKKNDSNDPELAGVVEDLKNIDCTIIVPSFIEQRLLAIIILGPKRSGKIYSHDDLVVFSILANQSALAIENAQFYEDMKRTHEQLFKAEKMATIGTMADGLSHQINNRLHAIGFVASDALDTIKIKQKDGVPEDMKEVMDDVAYALERIQDNVKRGGEIVGGLLKYTRKGSRGFEPLQLEKLFNAAIEMAGFKIKPGLVEFVTYLHPNLSPVVGNFTQLQEVFFNIIDNAYDAIVQRKEDLREEKYKGKIEILAVNKGKNVEIRIKDNGIGAKPEILAKLFTPFFTTKLSSRKGTGLGLYIIRQIIEENHHGSVKFDSRYGIGSETHIILPTGRPEEERSENAENTDDALEQPIN